MGVIFNDSDDDSKNDYRYGIFPAPTERGLHDLGPSLTERRQAAAEKALTTALIAAQEEMDSAAILDALINVSDRDGYYRRARALAAIAVDWEAEDQE